jgi:16S rRNA (cytidine1402-2'-O)-methyltransferase
MTLFVVATPIGNLSDMTPRALEVLGEVDCIAAEDTRHSKRLLDHFGIATPLVAYHEHNEGEAAKQIVRDLASGRQIALISDAGTPLISDPGYRLVKAALEKGIQVVPVPGASALVSALSVAGLPTDRFCFEGFMPAKSAARQKKLGELGKESRTIVLFEAPHRIRSLLEDVSSVLGGRRRLSIGRELTKQYEQIWHGTADEALAAVDDGQVPSKGEFVVVVEGSHASGVDLDEEKVMAVLLTELSPGTAASLASQFLESSRKHLYDVALSLKKR